MQDEIRAFHAAVVAPLAVRLGRAGAVDDVASAGAFRHAYALVSSRAFVVDAYHGLGMVPVADT